MRAEGCIFRASGREREKRVEEQTGVPNNFRAIITCFVEDCQYFWQLTRDYSRNHVVTNLLV